MGPIDLQDPSWDSWFDKVVQIKQTQETIVKGLPQPTLVPATGVPDIIACNVQPSGGRQVQLGPTKFEISSHVIYLRGYFPNAKDTMTAIVEGNQTHEILLVEQDGADCATTLITRKQ